MKLGIFSYILISVIYVKFIQNLTSISKTSKLVYKSAMYKKLAYDYIMSLCRLGYMLDVFICSKLCWASSLVMIVYFYPFTVS